MGEQSEANPEPNNKEEDKHQRWLLISCKGTPKRDGRAKRSQSRTSNKKTADIHKTKAGTNTARWLLTSCTGVPNRDGRAKRRQSLIKKI